MASLLWKALDLFAVVYPVVLVVSLIGMFVFSDDETRWLFLGSALVVIAAGLQILYFEYERKTNRVTLPDGAAEDSREFFLVLRSFNQTFTTRRGQRRQPVDFRGDFLRLLVRALHPHGAVLLVGGYKMGEAVVLRPPDRAWKRLVRASTEDAKAVILIPSLSFGVREEILEICQGPASHKLIVCVPPDYDPTALEEWKRIRDSYACLGVHFPAYHREGFVYRPFDASLQMAGSGDQVRPLGQNGRSLDDELSSLVGRIAGSGRPFRSSLPKLLDLMNEPDDDGAPAERFLPPLHTEVLRVACRLAKSSEDGWLACEDLRTMTMPGDDEAAFWEIVEEFVVHGFIKFSLFRSKLTITPAGHSHFSTLPE